MKIKVETTWMGKVAVRDKFVKMAKDAGESLVIVMTMMRCSYPTRRLTIG